MIEERRGFVFGLLAAPISLLKWFGNGDEDENQHSTTSYSYDFGSNWEDEIDKIEKSEGKPFSTWLRRI